MLRDYCSNTNHVLFSSRFLLASSCLLLFAAPVVLTANTRNAHQETGAAAAQQRAVEVAVVTCATTKGEVEMTFYQNWSPQGYDRAVKLFQEGFYDHSHFFRVVPDFLVQFGISYTTNAELQTWSKTPIPDDTTVNQKIPFEPGTISYAGSGPNSRTSHLFISFMAKDDPNNQFGVNPWETPVGKVTKGLQEVAQQWYSGYGDMPPWGKGPEQQKIYEGPQYIDDNFPQLDKFLTCQVETKMIIVDVDPTEEATSNPDKSQDVRKDDGAGKVGKVKGETTTETETETTLPNDSRGDDNSSEDDSNDSEEDATSNSSDEEESSDDGDEDDEEL